MDAHGVVMVADLGKVVATTHPAVADYYLSLRRDRILAPGHLGGVIGATLA